MNLFLILFFLIFPFNAYATRISVSSGGGSSSGSASAAGGTSAVQYNSGSSTFAGDATKFSFNGTNVGIGTSSGLALLSINSSAAQDLFRVDDSAGSDATPFLIDQTGNVGIGTATPQAVLSISSTLAQALFRVDDNGSGDLDPFIIDQNGNVGIGTTNTERDRLLVMGGNVGIGTWVPSTMLDVAGTIVTTSGGNLVTGGNIGIGTNILGNAGLAVMGGNVGIGTWVPSNNLFVIGNIGIGTSAGYVIGNSTGGSYFQNNVGIGTWIPGNTLAIVSQSGSTNAVTITANSQSSGSTLQVSSSTNSSAATGFAGDFRESGANNVATSLYALNSGSVNLGAVVRFDDASSDPSPFMIDANGNIGIGTVWGQVQKLSIVGNVGIGTVKDGDSFITTTPPNGGMLIEGNVGIGTTLSGTTAGLSVMNGNVGIGTWVPSGSIDAVSTSGTSDFKILNGNVGIGTNSNGGISKLFVVKSASNFSVDSSGNTVVANTNNGNGNGWSVNSSAASFSGTNNTAGSRATYRGGTTATSQVVIASSSVTGNGDFIRFDFGNLGIGTTNVYMQGGNVGIGTISQSRLGIFGNIGIGTIGNGDNYLTTAAPSGGMIIEGNVGVGTYLPIKNVHVGGDIFLDRTSSTIWMREPDGTCGSCTLSNAEVFTCVSATCP